MTRIVRVLNVHLYDDEAMRTCIHLTRFASEWRV
jgi:hypothetical protein